jgi:hypothetical protein
MRWAAAITGVSIPAPEVVPPESPLPILEWIESVLRARRTPHLWTYASAAVRVCRAAREVGIDISGTRMTMSGEPITAARVSAVREAGAVPIPRCGVTETGSFGFSCIAPAAPDDMHVMHDLVAVIQPGSEAVDQLPGDALLLSSLRPAARLILINVSAGDQATLEHRVCGCRMETLGWRIHVYTLRSFEKLTAAGMTFLDADVIRVLEEVLPARFGGGPTDYQLVDEESHDGRANLRLLVDPRVGPLDDAAVADTFLASIGGGSGAQRVMELQWRQAGVVSIERRPPLPTASGKILHLVRTGQPSVG